MSPVVDVLKTAAFLLRICDETVGIEGGGITRARDIRQAWGEVHEAIGTLRTFAQPFKDQIAELQKELNAK